MRSDPYLPVFELYTLLFVVYREAQDIFAGSEKAVHVSLCLKSHNIVGQNSFYYGAPQISREHSPIIGLGPGNMDKMV